MALICDFRVVGPVQTNCYFLYDEKTKKGVLVDPGDEAEKLLSYIGKKGLQIEAILLTHGHFDHIMAVPELKKELGVPVYVSRVEKEVLEDPMTNLSLQMGGRGICLEADHYLEDGDTITLLGEEVRCILTPGHTVGGMCYYFPKAGILFSGDTLFQESVGRTDFPGGSMKELIRSIREKLFVLASATRVYPGHGFSTSIETEKMFNPFATDGF
ncbi:MAG: MBL fold metallo-hydrolase [Lachnospiraceae bacterium]|nr:MBL fold metallo-hydrolase [Lachnospiraceae bacterium]